MAKKEMCSPHRCPLWSAVLWLLVGLWFVLADLAVLPAVPVNWWSALFVLAALKMLGKAMCPQCE